MGKSSGKAILSVAGLFFGAFNPTAFGFAAGVNWAAGIMGASLFGNIWSATHQKKDSSSQTYSFDVLQNTSNADARIPVIYGTRKWGGYQTWHSTSSDKTVLTKDVLLCEGQISGISSVKANNILISDGSWLKYSGTSNVYFVVHKIKSAGWYSHIYLFVNGVQVKNVQAMNYTTGQMFAQIAAYSSEFSYHDSGMGGRFIDYYSSGTYYLPQVTTQGNLDGCSTINYTGAPTQSPPSNYDTVGGYKNCAWTRATLTSSAKLQGSNPTITCIVNGLLINDTRTSTFAYSENPAMIVRDYLLAKRYGLGRWIDSSMIDEDSFKECADYCDEVIAYYVPSTLSTYDAVQSKISALQLELDENPGYSTETRDNITDSINSLKKSLLNISTQPVSQELVTGPRYTTNIILADVQSHLDDLSQLLATFGGFLVFNGNKVGLRMEKNTEVSYDFTDDSICRTKEGKVDIKWETTSLADAPNQYSMKFYDPNNEYVGVKIQANDYGNQRERGKVVTKEVTLAGVTSQSQALRLGRIYLAKTKMCYGVCTFSTGTHAMHLQPGDVITITHGVLNKQPMRIVSLAEDNGKWTIKCQQWNSSIYSDYLDQSITFTNYTTIPNAFTDTVPNVTAMDFDQNYYVQSDGTAVSTITGTCKLPTYPFYSSTNIYVSTDLGITYSYLMSTTTGEFTMQGAIVGQVYIFKAVVVNTANRSSTGFISSQLLCTGKDSPPSDLKDFVVAQYNSQFVLQGKIPSDVDFNHCELRYDGTDWASSVFLATDITSFPTYISNTGVMDGTHVFRIKAVDNGGNYSANDKEYVLTVMNINTYKNVILSRNDLTDGLGTLENTVQLPSGYLVNPSGITYGDILGYDYTQYPTTYSGTNDTTCTYTSQVIDTGKIGWTNVNFCFKFESFADIDVINYGMIQDRTYGDYPSDTYQNISLPFETVITVRFSNDNITWTNWQTYVSAEYNFRYIQYKVIGIYTEGSRFFIESLQQYYDVHDVTVDKTISVPAGGTTVVYDEAFYSNPSDITMTVVGTTAAIYPRYTSNTKNSITITCYDTSGISVAASVHLIVKGY